MTAPKKLLLVFTACLLALCATLCVYAQCATSSDVISTSAVVRLFRSPELTLVGEQPYQLPSILYVGDSERLSAELEEYYSPVIEILRGANSDGEIAHMQYELSEPSDGSNYLSAYIVADCGMVIHLPDVVISRSGEAVFSQMPDLGYLADSSFAGGYFRLMQRGVDVLPSRKEETVCLEDMCALMTGYYECMLGREVDISRFSDAESGKQYLKALELGLCGEYDSFTDDSEVTTTRLAGSVQGLLERLSIDFAGRSSQNVSLDDAVAVTRFFAQIYDLCGDE
ncbi:MAG: hypothetical protein IJP17_01425 [Clostridia bacterium]|nr:hypothetical protein [Clostridia bacterium]